MLAWIFQTAGKRPNFLVGGVARNSERVMGLAAGKSSFLKVMNMKRRFGTAGQKFFHYHPDD